MPPEKAEANVSNEEPKKEPMSGSGEEPKSKDPKGEDPVNDTIGSVVAQRAGMYGLEPEAFVDQSDKALSFLADLVEAGKVIVDEDGNFIAKKQEPKRNVDDSNNNAKKASTKDNDLNSMRETLKSVEDAVKALMDVQIVAKVKSTYPLLSDDDIRNVVTLSRQLGQSIDATAKQWTARYEEVKKRGGDELMSKYNVDMAELEKRLSQKKELTPSDIKGAKRLSFEKGEGTITPKEAIKAFLG